MTDTFEDWLNVVRNIPDGKTLLNYAKISHKVGLQYINQESASIDVQKNQ